MRSDFKSYTVKSRSSRVKLLSSSRKSAFKSFRDIHCEAPKLRLLRNVVRTRGKVIEYKRRAGIKKHHAAPSAMRCVAYLGLNDKNPLPSSSALVSEMSSCSRLARTAYIALRSCFRRRTRERQRRQQQQRRRQRRRRIAPFGQHSVKPRERTDEQANGKKSERTT